MADAERAAGRSQAVAVIGAGITGLSAAYLLSKTSLKPGGPPLDVSVIESSPRVGGKILTVRDGGRLLEAGPDSFVPTKPGILELIEELGLSGELIGAEASNRRLYVYSDKRLKLFPDVTAGGSRAAWAVMSSPLLSLRSKLRLAFEPFVSPAPENLDESLGAFIRRRLGDEALDKLAGPLLAGLYAADADGLSLQSTFPRLRELDRRGGILRALLKYGKKSANGKAARPRASFMTLKNGLSGLAEALALALPAKSVRTQTPVSSLKRRNGIWEIETPMGLMRAKAVVAALPAPGLSKLVAGVDPELASALSGIPVATTATVTLAYPLGAFSEPPKAFGFLVAPKERGLVSAATYVSSKFPGRAVPGEVLVRCFLVGKEGRPLEGLSETELTHAAHSELKNILGLNLPEPVFFYAYKWTEAVPQYSVGHELRLARIASGLKTHPGLVAAGCFYRGVGIPDCIEQGFGAAREILEFLA